MARGSAFIAAATYAGIAAKQSILTERTVSATENATAIAAQSFRATAEQFRLGQRAWVGVVTVNRPELKPKQTFAVTLNVVNSGHTPALDFESRIVLHSLLKGEKFVPIYNKIPVGEEPSRGVIQPGETVPVRSREFPITQPQIDAVVDGRIILYVYGKMQYRDALGGPVHHTTFCKEVLSEELIRDCGTYNYAD